MNPDTSPTNHIFTIGHSNHAIDRFIDLLRTYGIEVLVDVRSQPYSKYAVQFNSKTLKSTIKDTGIKYIFLGKELGGRPEELEFYDADGHVLYARVAESPIFREGIARLEKGIQEYRVAIMCSEENPTGCHRRLLISRVLRNRGILVQHIRGDGSMQTEAELTQGETANNQQAWQPSLFGEQEVEVWRSIRSVLPKGNPENSSLP
jgi:uncharacterized protein (DUF488 family)